MSPARKFAIALAAAIVVVVLAIVAFRSAKVGNAVASLRYASPPLAPAEGALDEWSRAWSEALPVRGTLTQSSTYRSFGMSGASYRTYKYELEIENRTSYAIATGESLYLIETSKKPAAGDTLSVAGGYFLETPPEDYSGAAEFRRTGSAPSVFSRASADDRHGGDAMGLLNSQTILEDGGMLRVLGSMFEMTTFSEGKKRDHKTAFGRAEPGKSLKLNSELTLAIMVREEQLDEIWVVSPSLIAGHPKRESVPFVYLLGFTRATEAKRSGEAKGSDEAKKWSLAKREILPLTGEAFQRLASRSDEPLWRRVFAARWSGKHAPKEAVPLLTKIVTAMPKENEALRIAAATAIGFTKDPSALPLLESIARNPSEGKFTRRAAVQAIGKLGNRSAVPFLIAAAEKGDDAVSETAVASLGELGDRSAVPPLLAVLSDEGRSALHPSVGTAVAKLADESTIGPLQQIARERYGSGGGAAVSALGAIGTPSAVRALAELYAATPSKRIEICNAVAETDRPEALALLTGALGDSDLEIRRAAVYALGRLQTASRKAAIVDAIGHADPEVRKIAISQAADRTIAEAKPKIAALVRETSGDETVRQAAVNALSRYPGNDSIPLLTAALKDPSPSVRESAISGLQFLQAKESAGEVAALTLDPDPQVRRAAAFALGGLGSKAQAPAIVRALLQEKDASALHAEANALVSMKFDQLESFPKIVEKFRNTEDSWVRDSLATLLAQMSGKKIELRYDATKVDVDRAAKQWNDWWQTKQGS